MAIASWESLNFLYFQGRWKSLYLTEQVPRKGPPRFLTEHRRSNTKSGLVFVIVFIVFSCLGLLSCIKLCIFLCRLVLFVSTLVKWLAGKTYSRDIFCVKGFPLQRPDWRVIYCNGFLCVFLSRNIVSFLIYFTFLTATYLSKAQYSLFALKLPLNPNQSIYLMEEVLENPWISLFTFVVLEQLYFKLLELASSSRWM